MDEKKKQWCCKNGHILGFIRWNGQGVPQLMVLREALDMAAEPGQKKTVVRRLEVAPRLSS